MKNLYCSCMCYSTGRRVWSYSRAGISQPAESDSEHGEQGPQAALRKYSTGATYQIL